jgi:hypothetical protein
MQRVPSVVHRYRFMCIMLPIRKGCDYQLCLTLRSDRTRGEYRFSMPRSPYLCGFHALDCGFHD